MATHVVERALRIWPGEGIQGTVSVPPDKSISHRAAILAAMADGTSVIRPFLPALDTLGTLRALRAFGVGVDGPDTQGRVVITGRPEGFAEPPDVVDAGNSGTTIRLLSGVAASQPGLFAVLTGDASLRRRPMGRIIEPLRAMGARIDSRTGMLAPLAIRGASLSAIRWGSSVASAQVKSAVLLAGLRAAGRTRLEEPLASRDHTERMLEYLGARIAFGPGWAEVDGPQTLHAQELQVPGDPSSAAFAWVAAAILPGSRVTTVGVCLNPSRIAALHVLEEMGVGVTVERTDQWGGEDVGDVTVEGPPSLRPLRVAGPRIPLLIDEIPALTVAALAARGTSVIAGAAELRHKESDRIGTFAAELGRLGLEVRPGSDGFVVEGPQRPQGGEANAHGDHRLAMSLVVAALAGVRPSVVKGTGCIDTSFPGFAAWMGVLVAPGGGRIEEWEMPAPGLEPAGY